MRHLTRIVGDPVGVNLLGLLELFASIAILSSVSFVPKAVGLLMLCLGPPAVAAFDLWWRIRQPERSWWARLFSPFTGGCFIYLPIWLVLLAEIFAGIIFIIIAIAQR